MSAARGLGSIAGAARTVLAGALCAAAVCLLWVVPARAATPPTIVEASVANVASGSATFQAQINADGADTTYRFEYGTSEAYGQDIPVPDGEVGGSESAVPVQEHPQDLQPHTTYHFRVVVTNAEGTAAGIDQVFTTQAAGGELVLPDSRAWELVSSPDKHGALIEPITFEGSPVQAAAAGNAMAYATDAPTEANPAGSRSPETMEALSRRGPSGWSSHDVAPPHSTISSINVGNGQEERFFSLDLTQSIIEPRGTTLLSPQATEQTIYLRNDALDDFTPLVTAANVAAGVKFGSPSGSRLEFDDATPDLSHIVLRSPTALLTPALGKGGLYEWSNGQLELVSVLPDGTVKEGTLGAQLPQNNRRHTISNDGDRVIWSIEEIGELAHLYLTDMAKHETVELDAVQGGSAIGATYAPYFQTASSDGSKIFFTDFEDLTADAAATPGEPDLYEFEIAANGKLSGTLKDLTVASNPGEAADVQGTLPGASEDGADVYFVAKGRLTSEPRAGCLTELDANELAEETAAQTGRCRAQSGADNLYLRKPDPARPGQSMTVFIASLGTEDQNDWNGLTVSLTSRVSPNGRYLAFMSNRSLTGYDNHDANSGAPDEEVYLYDADSGHIVCASCNPSGARPVGIQELSAVARGPLYDAREFWRGKWLAANVPGWTGMSLETSIYQSRYLSDSGRLFFNSADALVAQDTDGVGDVYEYEPSGVGDCDTSNVTFSERSDGCVGLISSGASSEEAAFLDASESGNDVFFLTNAPLAAQDRDTAFDVYDAHACSEASPCPAVAVTPPACTTADSCRAAPMPQPALFGAPASATFSGFGNVAPVAPAVAPKTKRQVQRAKVHRRKPKPHRERHKSRRHPVTGKRRQVSALTGRGTGAGRGR